MNEHFCLNLIHIGPSDACSVSERIKMTGVLPVEDAPVTELLLGGVCRNIVVHVNELWEEMFYNLCSHHYRGVSRKAESAHE